LLGLPFYPEDGGDNFLRNVELSSKFWRYNPEDRTLHSYRLRNLKYQISDVSLPVLILFLLKKLRLNDLQYSGLHPKVMFITDVWSLKVFITLAATFTAL
jgi:hypothetical protein